MPSNWDPWPSKIIVLNLKTVEILLYKISIDWNETLLGSFHSHNGGQQRVKIRCRWYCPELPRPAGDDIVRSYQDQILFLRQSSLSLSSPCQIRKHDLESLENLLPPRSQQTQCDELLIVLWLFHDNNVGQTPGKYPVGEDEVDDRDGVPVHTDADNATDDCGDRLNITRNITMIHISFLSLHARC